MHRWPTFCGVQLTEGGIEPIEGLIRQFPAPAQWMAGRDPLLVRHVGEQGAAALPVPSHVGWTVGPYSRVIDFSAILSVIEHTPRQDTLQKSQQIE